MNTSSKPATDLPATFGPEMPPHLLVVDDQPINIQAPYRIFHADHEVYMATSGPKALEICANNPPDLILRDVVMPECDHARCRAKQDGRNRVCNSD